MGLVLRFKGTVGSGVGWGGRMNVEHGEHDSGSGTIRAVPWNCTVTV